MDKKKVLKGRKRRKIPNIVQSDEIVIKSFYRNYSKFVRIIDDLMPFEHKAKIEKAAEKSDAKELMSLLNTVIYYMPITHETLRPEGYKELTMVAEGRIS